MTGIGRLRAELSGEVIEPGSAGYDTARRPAMARFRDVRPRAVVRVASAEDVARTFGFAREAGVRVVPRGGGHCFAGRSSTEGIVVDLGLLRSISVQPNGFATIGAGARLGEVYDGLAEHGRTLPAGCGAGVGIAGLTLGGGLGLLGRRYGLTCDRLVAARVVLADGRIVECAEDREPELFWALRGAGGGQFGVVTSLVFDTVPAPEATRFTMTWPRAGAGEIIAAWQEWAPDAPDEVSANLTVTGDQVTLFGAAVNGLAVGSFERTVFPRGTTDLETLPWPDLKRSLSGPEPDGPAYSTSELFQRSLPAEAIARLLDAQTPGGELHFTALGGAYNRVPEEATAFAHRGERFMVEHVSGADPGWARRSREIVHPWGSGRVYPNFPDPELANAAEAYHGGNLARLREVKRRYDPDRLFHFHQSL